MPDTPAPTSLPAIQAQLRDIAAKLTITDNIEPESLGILAELVGELNRLLAQTEPPPTEVMHLAASTAHLAEQLHRRSEEGVLAKARDRLEAAVISAEGHAPLAVAIARRLLDALVDLGI
jgi:hypothetical protein